MAFMAIAMDETVRDELVTHSPYFARFVRIRLVNFKQDAEKQKYFK